MTDVIIQFFPLMIIQAIYAVVVFLVARRRRITPWLWIVFVLVPGAGVFVGAVFFVLTLLSILDRLNALEGRGSA